MSRGRPAKFVALAMLLAALAAPRPAAALQPLGEFLGAARQNNLDRREAAVTAEQRQHQLDQARWDLTPVLSVTGSYARNQYEAKVTLPGADPMNPVTRTITPYNQLDAQISLTQPLVEVGAWLQVSAAKANVAAGEARLAATEQTVQQAVAQAYFQLVAADAVLRSAQAAQEAARLNLSLFDQRAGVGVASELDRRRAEVEVERVRKTLADAEYGLAIARQRLVSLTGVVPEDGAIDLQVVLGEEAPLAAWTGDAVTTVPSVRAAAAETEAAQATYRAAKGVLYPSLSASANQRFTNATGFLGKYAIASAGVNLSWRFDLAAIPQLRAQKSQAALAAVRADRARQSAHDQVHQAWHQVRAALTKARAARVERETSVLALKLARERYAAGAGLYLEVTQAERDALAAEISRIQADADLALARVSLRIAAGRPLDDVAFTVGRFAPAQKDMAEQTGEEGGR